MKLETHFFTNEARILDEQTPMDILKEITTRPNQEDPFYILDAGDIVQKIKYWRLIMPRVKPFYAVKCNDDLTVLELLAALGTGFDCASKSEMQRMLSLGVEPSRIIYAHPCKPQSHLKVAAKNNIDLMTFDNETELYKVKSIFPQARLVLRIRCDTEETQCPFGIKFGVYPEDAETLLTTAKTMGLNVVGVSFHVGSGCKDPPVFQRAIAEARQVFDLALECGFSPYLLDIGGGFPGEEGSSFDDLASIINSALEQYFPSDCGVEIIAEPGRYVVGSAFTLATNVVAKREVKDNDELVSTMYYINDGVYSSFNCILYDHQKVEPIALKNNNNLEEYKCSIWGPTCDGLDQVVVEARLPILGIGDWIIWKNMGAYTLAAAGTFNGFPKAKVHVVVPHHTWLYLEEYMGTNLVVGESNNPLEKQPVLPAYLLSYSNTIPNKDLISSANNFEDKFAKMELLDFEECGEM